MSKIILMVIKVLIGVLIGSTAGFVLGVVGWLAFFYLFYMLPNGTPFRHMDQGAIGIVLTGPLGAIIGGAVAGSFVFIRCYRTRVAK